MVWNKETALSPSYSGESSTTEVWEPADSLEGVLALAGKAVAGQVIANNSTEQVWST